MRVPIRVEYNDGVGGGEIDAQAAGSSGEKEAEVGRSFGVEMVQGGFPKIASNPAVESLKGEMAQSQVIAQQIQHPNHLRENQDPE